MRVLRDVLNISKKIIERHRQAARLSEEIADLLHQKDPLRAGDYLREWRDRQMEIAGLLDALNAVMSVNYRLLYMGDIDERCSYIENRILELTKQTAKSVEAKASTLKAVNQ